MALMQLKHKNRNVLWLIKSEQGNSSKITRWPIFLGKFFHSTHFTHKTLFN